MTPEQYAASQAAISAQVVNFVTQVAKFLIQPGMTVRDWLGLLQAIFPEVSRQREQSAALARQFYDSQRSIAVPELPRNDRILEGTDFAVFVKAMEPARQKVLRSTQLEAATSLTDRLSNFLTRSRKQNDAAVTHLTMQVLREVENAGRRQIINAVEDDTDLDQLILSTSERESALRGELVRGWARVATGRETCAFCLTMISRGPVYLSASGAGLDLDDESAVESIVAGDDVREFMEDWHTGCDCKVVPVFKVSEWAGRDAWKRAEDLYKDARTEAERVLAEAQKYHTTGKRKGKPVTIGEETIRALRRRLERGDISMTEFSALAA